MREDYKEPGELSSEQEEGLRDIEDQWIREYEFEEARKSRKGWGGRIVTNIYLPKGSKTLWLKYSKNGKPVWENTYTNSLAEAKKIRDLRLGQRVTHTLPELRINRIVFDEIARISLCITVSMIYGR